MDLEPGMRQAARRVASVLHEYALQRGWKYARGGDFTKGDYFLNIRANEDWLRFEVTLVAKAVNATDLYAEYDRVQEWIEDRLRDEPELAEAVWLVLMSPEEFSSGGNSSLNEGDHDIDDLLIESMLPTTSPTTTNS
jgi:hypothetical protein